MIAQENSGALRERIFLRRRRGARPLFLREQEAALSPEGRQLHPPEGKRQLEGAGGVVASAAEAVAGAAASRTTAGRQFNSL